MLYHTVPPISPRPLSTNNKTAYHVAMLHKLDTGKANGPDAISARMLKHTASAIASSFTELFNLSICTGQLPKDWKVSYVVPITKRPREKSPSDFWPKSLATVNPE